MMRRERLKIDQPCSADWERMDGDGVVRVCRLCNKHVHDLTQMSEAEARELLSSADPPCVRYLYDAQGAVLFAERPQRSLSPGLAAAAALALGGLAVGGCIGKPPSHRLHTESPPAEAPEEAPQPAAPADDKE